LLTVNVNDQALLAQVAGVDKVGVDAPFGWPGAFVEAVVAHHAGSPWPSFDLTALCYRATDRFVHDETGRRPLSVSSDRIAVTAMRAAGLLSKLAERGNQWTERAGKSWSKCTQRRRCGVGGYRRRATSGRRGENLDASSCRNLNGKR